MRPEKKVSIMRVKCFYKSPVCEPVYCEMGSSLLNAVSTAMTISLIEFGDDPIGDGGEL